MNILYFTRGQSPHDLRFLNSLAGSGHRVGVLCLEPSAQVHWPQGIEVLHWPGGVPVDNKSAVPAVKEVAGCFQADVIHAGPIQQVAYIAALADLHPLLTMSWGSDILLKDENNPQWEEQTRFTLQKTDLFAADCQTVVNKAREFGYAGPVCVFPWGVDLQHFLPAPARKLKEQLGWQENFVLLCNRSFEPVHGVDVLVKAFVLACRQNGNLRLLLYGKGSQQDAIMGILRQEIRERKVFFGGFVGLEDLPEVYRSANLYVSPSHSDGSSVSLMEALACGIPALVSDIPSNCEWIEPGKAGWLFRDGDERDLARQILHAASTEPSYLKKEARALAEKRADWRKNFAILLAGYQHVYAQQQDAKHSH